MKGLKVVLICEGNICSHRVAGDSFHGNTLTGNMDFLQWSCHEVARWIESIGFPQYKACFTHNFISGRKLIYVNCIYLPRLGITDFKDMQVISACVRELLGITETRWSSSIADPLRDNMGLFLEQRSRTGERAEGLTYQQSSDDTRRREKEPNVNHNSKGGQ
ncbi:sterile alpha motif domain-containing protein 15-like [Hippoglossus hippoglossus]|uniref:sterile alpha motif domain-containing protein 15-like n=1 Tax=Hippoglossus hippoglossus TaxID=8267 RepID=UPI00148D9E72|nr:sterile alpha motif domain-containing protein 15-like [Hippoglossus hippoglossus]